MAEKTIKQLEEEIKTLTAKHKEEVQTLTAENMKALKEIETLKNSTPVVDEEREFIKTASIQLFASNMNENTHNVVEYAKVLSKEVFNNINSK